VPAEHGQLARCRDDRDLHAATGTDAFVEGVQRPGRLRRRPGRVDEHAACVRAAVLGVYGEAPIGIGVQGRGSVYGVRGFTDDASGRGVDAQNTTGGTALETAGAVKFSSAGLATVPTGAKQVTIPAGVDVTSATKVLVTPMSEGRAFKFVEADAGPDTLTFRLAKSATSNLKLAYFVIS
jgi:hypothetical protein